MSARSLSAALLAALSLVVAVATRAAAGPAAPTAAVAPPPPPPPVAGEALRSGDDVVLVRTYVRTGKGTQPVARLGMSIHGAPTRQAFEITEAASPATGPFTVTLTARRKSDNARVDWELVPGAGARIPAGKGTLKVAAGSMGHAELGKVDDATVFASFEVGRASDMGWQRMAEHFGAVAPAAMPSAPSAGWPVVAPMAMAPPVAAPPPLPQGPSMGVACPGGSSFRIALTSGKGRCRLDLGDDHGILGGTCSDGEGDEAQVDCAVDHGRGACIKAEGLATCEITPSR